MGDDLREALMVGCDVTSLQFFKFHSNNRALMNIFSETIEYSQCSHVMWSVVIN